MYPRTPLTWAWQTFPFTQIPSQTNLQGGDSQNFLRKFVRFFVTLSLKILRFLGLNYILKQISLKGDVNYCINHIVPIFYE